MPNAIEYLEERDDVKKIEYSRVKIGGMEEVHLEMWHDVDGLHGLFQKSMTGHVSEKEMIDSAKNSALAVRKTTTSFKAESEKNEDYEYDVARGE